MDSDMLVLLDQVCIVNRLEHARAGFWGWQREGATELWDVHKSGYTDEQLIELVHELGYVNARSIRNRSDKHLEIVCYKG